MDKRCACGSNSTVLDGKTWVCWEHIEPCKCTRNHEIKAEWDFNQSRSYADGYTVEMMEFQTPEKHLTDIQNGEGRS